MPTEETEKLALDCLGYDAQVTVKDGAYTLYFKATTGGEEGFVKIPIPVIAGLFREVKKRLDLGVPALVRRLAASPDAVITHFWNTTLTNHLIAGLVVGQKNPDAEQKFLLPIAKRVADAFAQDQVESVKAKAAEEAKAGLSTEIEAFKKAEFARNGRTYHPAASLCAEGCESVLPDFRITPGSTSCIEGRRQGPCPWDKKQTEIKPTE